MCFGGLFHQPSPKGLCPLGLVGGEAFCFPLGLVYPSTTNNAVQLNGYIIAAPVPFASGGVAFGDFACGQIDVVLFAPCHCLILPFLGSCVCFLRPCGRWCRMVAQNGNHTTPPPPCGGLVAFLVGVASPSNDNGATPCGVLGFFTVYPVPHPPTGRGVGSHV